MSNFSFVVRARRWARFSVNYIKERIRGLDFSMVYVGTIQKNVDEFHGYSMTDEKDMKRMLKAIPVNAKEASFLDVGCGKGICMKCAVDFENMMTTMCSIFIIHLAGVFLSRLLRR